MISAYANRYKTRLIDNLALIIEHEVMSVDPNQPPTGSGQSPEWGGSAVMSLFQSVASLQVESGIFEAWKEWRLSGLPKSPGRLMPPANLPVILRDTFSELPLAVTRQKLEHGDTHDDYLLGLVKLNPVTGEMVPETWAYAAELEDGAMNGKYSPYDEEQLGIIHWQLLAQESLGIRLEPGREG